MPGWHDATKALQQSGAIQVVGIIQEQHADRCALFMQWKEMDWPIMVDSLDLLGVAVVPITVLIDEAGVVYKYRARTRDLEAFLAQPAVAFEPATEPVAPSREEMATRASGRSAADFRELGDALFLWGGATSLTPAINAYQLSLRDSDDAVTQFHMGAALQSRYEAEGDPADFAAAIKAWSAALAMNPNQYIWRRRIQQYGPRLDKPYSFYDWVSQAREAIVARGETPSPLLVEPRGAELAYPSRTFSTEDTQPTETDPEGRINRDSRSLIQIRSVVVPTTKADEHSSRVHLLLTPDVKQLAHWNNEADGLEIWIDPPEGWEIDRQRIVLPNPASDVSGNVGSDVGSDVSGAVSREVRSIEFELRPPAGTDAATVRGYALYYACEDVDGECLYLRQDFEIKIPG